MAIGVLRLHLLELEKVNLFGPCFTVVYLLSKGSRAVPKLHRAIYQLFEGENAD